MSVREHRLFRIVGLWHVFHPYRSLALVVLFGEGQMNVEMIGIGAMPMTDACRDHDRVSGLNDPWRLTFPTDTADSRQNVKRLTDRMRVPCGAPTWSKGDAKRAQLRRQLPYDYFVLEHRTGEITRQSLFGHTRNRSDNLYL